MPIRRKARVSPLNGFVSMIVPERIEEAHARVGEYFTEHLRLSFETPEGCAEVLEELFSQHGATTWRAVEGLLCTADEPLRDLIGQAVRGDAKTALLALVSQVSTRFGLAPAVALLVVTLAVKAAAAGGEAMVCEELVLQNRKTTRHLRSAHAHNRSVHETKSAARRNQAAKAKARAQNSGGRARPANTGGDAAAPRRPKPPKEGGGRGD